MHSGFETSVKALFRVRGNSGSLIILAKWLQNFKGYAGEKPLLVVSMTLLTLTLTQGKSSRNSSRFTPLLAVSMTDPR